MRTDDWSRLWVPLWSQRTGLGSVRSPTRLKADGLGTNQQLRVLELLLNTKLLSEVPIWRQSGPVRTGSKLSASKTNTRHQRLHSAQTQTHTHTHTRQAGPARAAEVRRRSEPGDSQRDRPGRIRTLSRTKLTSPFRITSKQPQLDQSGADASAASAVSTHTGGGTDL